jgi:hypothetical protein
MFKQLNAATTAWAEGDKAAAPFAMPSIADAAAEAYARTIAQVGATPWSRTATDRRLVNDVINYTGFAPITAPPADEWNAIMNAATVTRPVGWDTEVMPGNYFGTTTPRAPGDGMPTWWETLRGFNPNVDDKNVVTADGYTRLEKYLHYLGAQANWNLNADGNWSAHMNWRGIRPETKDASASFVSGITAPRTVTLDAPVTVGQRSFSSPIGYTVAGGAANALTVDVISGRALVDVSAGSHTIAAPLVLQKDALVHVADGAALTVTNLQPTNAAVIKQGGGTLNVNGVRAASLDVQGGAVNLIPGGGGHAPASRVAVLTIAAGAALDLADHKLIVAGAGGDVGTFDGTSYSGLTGRIASAYNFSAWDGPGIATSMFDAGPERGVTTIAIATADEVFYAGGTFGGVPVASGDVLLMYTYAGDLNLDGLVDGADYGVIDNAVQFPGTSGYANGDINYDGVIDGADYGVIDNTVQLQGAPFPSGTYPSFDGAGVRAVPEAGTFGLSLVAAAGWSLARRRRRM